MRTPAQTVLITGASRGLGREIALAFGRTECSVMVNYLEQEEAAAEVVNEIERAGGRAFLSRGDIRNSSEVDRVVGEAFQRMGSLGIVVNNAGITRDKLLLRMSEQDWDEVFATNLSGAFHVLRSAASIMTRQGYGHIINIASITGLQGREGQANYASSKAALIGLTKASARELGPSNIQVNSVLPGYLATDMGDKVSQAVIDRALQENTLRRLSDVTEVANFIRHLATARNISGQVFNLDSRIV